jgi:hypothetical protein
MRRLPPTALILFVTLGLVALPRHCLGQSAEELIPFSKLEPELRKELWQVAKRCTVKRKLAERRVACREATFHYLLRRLPLASRLVRELGLGRYVIEPVEGGGFSLKDNDGAFAQCEIVEQDAHRAIIVARGHVEAPLVPKVFGTGVIIIGTGVDPDDPSNIRTNCWNYFRLKSRALHRVSRAFRKTLGKVIERRLGAFVECAQTIAELVRKDPQKVYDTMKKLEVDESQLSDFKSRYLNRAGKR